MLSCFVDVHKTELPVRSRVDADEFVASLSKQLSNVWLCMGWGIGGVRLSGGILFGRIHQLGNISPNDTYCSWNKNNKIDGEYTRGYIRKVWTHNF